MLQLRKMNYEDAAEQWRFVTAMPKEEKDEIGRICEEKLDACYGRLK